jgi:hypothetical protein
MDKIFIHHVLNPIHLFGMVPRALTVVVVAGSWQIQGCHRTLVTLPPGSLAHSLKHCFSFSLNGVAVKKTSPSLGLEMQDADHPSRGTLNHNSSSLLTRNSESTANLALGLHA